VKEKSSQDACPLNSLYWHFMNKHRDKLANNPRIGMVYRNWDKQSKETREATLARADWCLEHLEEL
jgi:deoxyribodipyrimidine photolyase-related protein